MNEKNNNSQSEQGAKKRIMDLLIKLGKLTGDQEFFNKGEKNDLIIIGKRLATYLHDNNIHRIAFLDASARTAYICLMEAWKRLYPNEEIPEIYFVNPLGFNTSEEINSFVDLDGKGHLMPRIMAIAAKQIPDDLSSSEQKSFFQDKVGNIMYSLRSRSRSDVKEELKQHYRRLMNDTDSPLMLFDTCMHSGMSMDVIVKGFRSAGMKNIQIGLASHSDNYSGMMPSFVALDHAHGSCYPFSFEKLVEKTLKSVMSQKVERAAENEKAIQQGREVRETIKKIFNLQWDSVN